jgi:hypothetical protein
MRLRHAERKMMFYTVLPTEMMISPIKLGSEVGLVQ